MSRRRKSLDPQATRYRLAVTNLAKAEKRKAAAERSIAELRKKVRYYERAIPAERRAVLAAADKEKWQGEQMRRERWKEAERTLRAAARMVGMKDAPEVIMTRGKRKRRAGMAVELREGLCLAWDFRSGYLSGKWDDRHNRKALTAVSAQATPAAVGYMPAGWVATSMEAAL